LSFVGLSLGFCLISSSLVSLILFSGGRLELADVQMFWLTWWLGDALAVILFTPWVLLYVGEVDPYWYAWRGRIGLIILFGLQLILLSAQAVSRLEQPAIPASEGQSLAQSAPSANAANATSAQLQAVHAPWQTWLVVEGGLALLSLVTLFVLMANSRAARVEHLVAERTLALEQSREEAQRASKLLREAVESIALGFSLYDAEDRLVICNQAYRDFYTQRPDLILPGVGFEAIIRASDAGPSPSDNAAR
ncbi:MAG: PAS-domain containing protein, partial [Gammaproteobacteria bacterium]|nr:PAS-domain containing protein [Gammaproteobacteria bacterium]